MSDRILIEKLGQGRQGLRLLRDATSDHLCNVGVWDASDDFSFRSTTIPLDSALLIDAHVSAVQYDRTPRHIARGGIDHYQIALCVDGKVTYAAGRRSVNMRPGDLCLMDMAQESRTTLTPGEGSNRSQTLSLVLPRALLAPLLATPDGASATPLARESPQGRVIGRQLLALHRAGGAAAADESSLTTAALATLLADAIGSARDAEPWIDRANRHLLLASIKRHIGANLQTDAVSAQNLCRRLRLSRATLYRLFEPEGGLRRYVQEQRLNRAFARLAVPTSARTRMIDLAVDFHFASDSTFVRAFRRRFGLTPGEVRELSASRPDLRLGGGGKYPDSFVSLRGPAQN
jgi:AraC-like DNA-binding protein